MSRFIPKLIYGYVGVAEAFLLIRFLVALAPVDGQFTAWWLATTDPLLTPFADILSATRRIRGTMSIEFNTVAAMLLYPVAAELVLALYHWARHIGARFRQEPPAYRA